MVKQLNDSEISKTLKLMRCPYNGEQVASQNWKEFPIPNGRVYWWECTACKGWHILINDLSKDKPLDNSPLGTAN